MENIITGNVATLKFYYSSDLENENNLYFRTIKIEKELRFESERLIKEILGQQFEIERFEVREGSVEIIMSIFTAFSYISKYKNFIESINLLKSQLTSLFNKKICKESSINQNIKSKSNITINPNVLAVKANERITIKRLLIYYLMLTNLILLGITIFLILNFSIK